MDFALTDEQILLQETVASIVSSARDRRLVREGEDSADGYSVALTHQLTEIGVAGLLAPESAGGAGQSIFEFALVAEQLGRGAISTPLLAQAWGAQIPLRHLPNVPDAEAHGRRLAIGAEVMTMAHLEPGMHDEWSPVALLLEEADRGYTITGTKILVPYVASASAVLLSAVAPRGEIALCLIRLPHEGVTVVPHMATGGDPMSRLEFAGATIDQDAVLLRGPAAEAAVAESLDVGTVIELAYAVGLAAEAVAMSALYATERMQFGRPIGSFQAIAHRCADMRISLDAARVLVYRAAWELASHGVAAGEAIAVAKVFGDDALSEIFVNAHQVHGAIGFSMEHDLQLFTRRAKAVELGFGIKQRHLKRVAAFVGV